jgi:hypothetical protein
MIEMQISTVQNRHISHINFQHCSYITRTKKQISIPKLIGYVEDRDQAYQLKIFTKDSYKVHKNMSVNHHSHIQVINGGTPYPGHIQVTNIRRENGDLK